MDLVLIHLVTHYVILRVAYRSETTKTIPPNLNVYLLALVTRQNTAMSSTIQYAMIRKFGEVWRIEDLSTSLPQPTLPA